MNKRLYNWMYRNQRVPWDIGPRRELTELVESGRLQPCRAVDLGCGTASNAIFLDAAIQGNLARFPMRDDQERLFECTFQILGPNTAELTFTTAGQPAHPFAIRLARRR